MFRARLAVLTSNDLGQLTNHLIADGNNRATLANSYALALIYQQANRYTEAKKYLDQLDTQLSAHPMVELLRADVNLLIDKDGNNDATLAALSELYPERYSITEKRIEQLSRQHRYAEALDVAKHYLRHANSPNPLVWRQIASMQERLDDSAGSHESLARYFEAINELNRAANQLELALNAVPPSSQAALRLNASLKDLRNKASRAR